MKFISKVPKTKACWKNWQLAKLNIRYLVSTVSTVPKVQYGTNVPKIKGVRDINSLKLKLELESLFGAFDADDDDH